MICEKCGEPIAQDALYCENCGARAALQADARRRQAFPRLRGKACLWTKAEAGTGKNRRRRMLPGQAEAPPRKSVRKKCRLPTLPSRRKI